MCQMDGDFCILTWFPEEYMSGWLCMKGALKEHTMVSTVLKWYLWILCLLQHEGSDHEGWNHLATEVVAEVFATHWMSWALPHFQAPLQVAGAQNTQCDQRVVRRRCMSPLAWSTELPDFPLPCPVTATKEVWITYGIATRQLHPYQ